MYTQATATPCLIGLTYFYTGSLQELGFLSGDANKHDSTITLYLDQTWLFELKHQFLVRNTATRTTYGRVDVTLSFASKEPNKATCTWKASP